MIEIEQPKIECVEISEDNSYGRFVIEPLQRDMELRLVIL